MGFFLICCLLLFQFDVSLSKKHSGFSTLTRSTSTCPCGSSLYGNDGCQTSNRIVGGSTVRQNEYPWQAFIKICPPGLNCMLCGGSLVNKLYVVTASHCLFTKNGDRVSPSSIEVRLGEHNFRSDSDNTYLQVFSVIQTITHENYNTKNADNDIALLKLNREVTFTAGVKPICLPSSTSSLYSGSKVWTSGWGKMAEKAESASDLLQKVGLSILSNSDQICKNGAQRNGNAPDESKICAYGQNKDACQGDSGGPLVTVENGKCTLVGVVSYGIGCARNNMGGIYTRITHFLSWIKEKAASGGCFDGSSNPISPCDLRCTALGTATGRYRISGYLSVCNGGLCTAEDPSVNLCTILGFPCKSSSEILPCSPENQCNCRQVLSGIYGNSNQPEIVRLSLVGIAVTCNSRTGFCCNTLYPSRNLCQSLNSALGGNYF